MQTFQILLAEDFEPFRQFVCSTLRHRVEFQVTEALDGLEALRKTDQLQPDLILLDIGLPGLNGIEVAKCACKIAPAAKILFLSQESSADVVREALSAGANSYVQKVHAGRDLLPAIDVVLKGGRFVSNGLLKVPSTVELVTQPSTREYPWQRDVMNAFQSPRKSLPIKISVAERAISGRLRDLNLGKEERSALKRALWSLRVLLAEVTTRLTPANRKRNTA